MIGRWDDGTIGRLQRRARGDAFRRVGRQGLPLNGGRRMAQATPSQNTLQKPMQKELSFAVSAPFCVGEACALQRPPFRGEKALEIIKVAWNDGRMSQVRIQDGR